MEIRTGQDGSRGSRAGRAGSVRVLGKKGRRQVLRKAEQISAKRAPEELFGDGAKSEAHWDFGRLSPHIVGIGVTGDGNFHGWAIVGIEIYYILGKVITNALITHDDAQVLALVGLNVPWGIRTG